MKNIILKIPEGLRINGVKDKDLMIGSLPVKRVLGIFWDTEDDLFKFKIDFKDKPMTRRGILSVVSSICDPLGLACPFMLKGRKILQNQF